MDNFETVIEVIFVIFFLFGRFFLKLLVGGGKKSPRKSQPAQPEVPPQKATAPHHARSNDTTPTRTQSASPAPKRPGMVRWTRKKEAPSLGKMCESLKATFEVQKERAKSIANTCDYRNFTVLRTDVLSYAAQLDEFIRRLADAQDQKSVNRTMIDNYTGTAQLIDDRLSVFEQTLNERASSYSAQFNCADRIVRELTSRSRRRHRAGETIYQYLFGGVVLNPEIVRGGLYSVTVSQQSLNRPRAWSLIGAAFHEAIAHHGKYGTKIAGDLGLPQAVNSMSYFMATGRLMSTGLISSWMPWIYADVATTLQLGDAYAWAMLTKCEQGSDLPDLTRFSVNRRGQTLGMPLVPRLVSIHAAMQQLAVFDTVAFGDRVAALLSLHPNLTIDIEGREMVPLEAAAINGDLFQVAATLGATPLSVLGGNTIEEIAGTDFNTEQMSEIQNIADELRKGKARYGVRPLRLIIAIHMALQKERNAEARIEAAALESLQQHKHSAAKQQRLPMTGSKAPSTLEDVFSPVFLPQTIMIGALSKSRGGISHPN
ncbi:MAG: hypothetical protein JXX14_15275 [Deltaproteobacteria bacterium]|nr:hypothetical protein [Deltaproteobacteria bacterium]